MVHDYINLSNYSNREIDKNGFMHVKNCVVTKSEVNQYRGNEIPDWERLGLDPNKIYDVLRPAEEIEKSINQMSGLPILEDHDDVHDAQHPQKHMRIGSMGTSPEFDEPEAVTDLTFWNKKEIDEINSKRRDNLSMGYDYTAVLENGEYNGKKYQVRMKDIVWNHVALVDKGRVDGAKVSDKDPFSQKEAERRMLPNKREDFMQRLVAAYRNIFRRSGHMGMDAKNWRTPPKTNDPRVSWANTQLQEADKKEKAGGRFGKADAENMRKNAKMVIKEQTAILKKLGKDGDAKFDLNKYIEKNNAKRSPEEIKRWKEQVQNKKKLPMAGSKTGDRNMATKRKRNGDAEPAVGGSGEEVEEIKENRVVAGIKALLNEFENVHEEEGIDPGVTDEEASCLDKVRDFLDSFHNQGSEDEEAGTSMDPMDEDPEEEGMDEDPEEKKEEMGEDEDWPDNGKSPTGDRKRRGMDAAMIEKRITAKFKAKDRALDECADLIGSVQKARTLDSAMDVYAHTLKTNGIEIPRNANLSGLRGMVMMLKKSRVGDSMPISYQKPTGIDAQIQETIAKSPYAPRY